MDGKQAIDEGAPKTLTVAQLIEQLRKMPQDARVYTEGCDCLGEAASVEYREHDHTVEINRS